MATAARTCEIAAAHTARCVCEIAIPQGRWRSLWMSQSRCTSRWCIARGVAIARAACVAGGRAWRARQCVAQLDEMCLRDCHSSRPLRTLYMLCGLYTQYTLYMLYMLYTQCSLHTLYMYAVWLGGGCMRCICCVAGQGLYTLCTHRLRYICCVRCINCIRCIRCMRCVRAPGSSWELLGTPGSYWGLLGAPGSPWE